MGIQSTSTTSLQNRFDFRTSLGPLQRINCVPGHGLKNGLNVKVRGDYLAGLAHRTLFVVSSGFAEYLVRPYMSKSTTSARTVKPKTKKGKGRQMDSSYEVLGASDRDSEGTISGEEMDEDINGEEIREQVEGYMKVNIAKTIIAGIGFAMSTVGIWGDGAADLVIIEM